MKKGKRPGPLENAAAFLALRTHADFASLVGLTLADLERVINRPEYTEYRIRKKGRGYREISNPSPMLKTSLKRLSFYLNAVWALQPGAYAYGFSPKLGPGASDRNILGNARRHLGRNHIYNLDLKDFFPSISAKRIHQLFKGPPFLFNEEVSTVLALLTTFRRSLPAGANTSPILSNFVCLELDDELSRLSSANEIEYTRYADDLTFSSDLPFTPSMKKEIRKIIEGQGYIINNKKERTQSRHRRQVVTGIKVNEKPNLDRRYIRNLRALLHDWELNGLHMAVRHHFSLLGLPTYEQLGRFITSTEGKISFVGFVRGRDDVIYLKLHGEFERLMENARLKIHRIV
jgi:RNA-directed DNA polymerase